MKILLSWLNKKISEYALYFLCDLCVMATFSEWLSESFLRYCIFKKRSKVTKNSSRFVNLKFKNYMWGKIYKALSFTPNRNVSIEKWSVLLGISPHRISGLLLL